MDALLSRTHARWLAEDGATEAVWRELDGTLLFADVSGFTKLAERLAGRGRRGAEELTDAIDHTFTVLLAPLRELGGDVLKFGGDAILVLFSGDAHAQRGAAAALELQDAMRPLRRLRTPGGTVELRLSAGVATGRLHLFLVGDRWRELLVCGPLASEVCACESAAEAGEVAAGQGGGPVAGVVVGEPRGPGRILLSAPQTGRPGLASLPSGVDLRAGLPAHLHEELGDGEHRTVPVGFVQFKGIDGLLRAGGPGAVAGALDSLVRCAQEACARHDVTFVTSDVDGDGGKLVLVAGAPAATTAEVDRLLHALREIVASPSPLRVRAGAHRGTIFCGHVGPAQRRTWTTMGDAVNLAARVMGRAPAGGVLATTELLGRARDPFGREPLEPFLVKGKTHPVHAEVVGEVLRTDEAVTPRARAVPVVGRDAELGVLGDAWTAACRGEGSVVELAGEPGIGKTAIVEAVIAGAGGAVVRVQAGPYAAFSPFRALVEPLRRLVGAGAGAGPADVAAALENTVRRVDPELLDWLPLLGLPLGLELEPTDRTRDLGPQQRQEVLRDLVGRLVDDLLPDEGALVVLEDGHWLDEASTELLARVAPRLAQRGRLVLATRRETPTGLRLSDHGARLLPLGPIDPAAAEALLRQEGDEIGMAPEVIQALVDRAAGNPLFLYELAEAARSTGSVHGLPDSVEGLIAARIDALPREDRALLRQAAVLGIRFPAAVAADLLGLDDEGAAAAWRRMSDFLSVDEQGVAQFHHVAFRHALLRDGAYASLSFRRREELHGRAATLIESRAGEAADEWAELLSLHNHLAHRWTRSWRWSQTAAEQAARRAAPGDAARFLRRALEAVRHLPEVGRGERAAVHERLGDLQVLAGRLDEAATAYRQARRLRPDEALRLAELMRKEGRLRERSHNPSVSVRWYRRARAQLDAIPPSGEVIRLRCRLEVSEASARLRQGRLRDCLPLLVSAVGLAESIDDQAILAHAYALMDWTHTDLGTGEAPRFRRLALATVEEVEDLYVRGIILVNAGAARYFEGRWAEALELYERSSVTFERLGDLSMAAMAKHNIAEVLLDQGDLDRAEALLRDALATFTSTDYAAGVGMAWGNLGRVAARRGEPATALERYVKAREQLTEIDAGAHVQEVLAREAEALVLAGRPEEALALVEHVAERAGRSSSQPTLHSMLERVAGLALAADGHTEEAAARLRRAAELAVQAEAPFEEALALAALGGDDAARAAEIFDRLDVRRTDAVPAP